MHNSTYRRPDRYTCVRKIATATMALFYTLALMVALCAVAILGQGISARAHLFPYGPAVGDRPMELDVTTTLALEFPTAYVYQGIGRTGLEVRIQL